MTELFLPLPAYGRNWISSRFLSVGMPRWRRSVSRNFWAATHIQILIGPPPFLDDVRGRTLGNKPLPSCCVFCFCVMSKTGRRLCLAQPIIFPQLIILPWLPNIASPLLAMILVVVYVLSQTHAPLGNSSKATHGVPKNAESQHIRWKCVGKSMGNLLIASQRVRDVKISRSLRLNLPSSNHSRRNSLMPFWNYLDNLLSSRFTHWHW